MLSCACSTKSVFFLDIKQHSKTENEHFQSAKNTVYASSVQKYEHQMPHLQDKFSIYVAFGTHVIEKVL